MALQSTHAVKIDEKVEVNFNELHPLQNTWTMWYDAPQTGNDWEDKLQVIHSFSTVEDFWRLFNSLAAPSMLPLGSNYHLFKSGVKPTWEDSYNQNGGKWTVLLPRAVSCTDNAWLYALLALIGEELDEDEEVCGAVISLRSKQDKLAIWTKQADRLTAISEIGRRLKQCLSLDSSHKIDYTAHDNGYSKAPFRNGNAY